VTVCVVCNDTGTAVNVGGATVKLGGFEEYFIPTKFKSQLSSPLVLNASRCYEKKIVLGPSTDFKDPHGVLDNKTFKIDLTDKNGTKIPGSPATVTITPVP
jgi:hypothetical protein